MFFFLANVAEISRHSVPLLGGLWSLAVEEHFYFAWPFAVRSLSRSSLIKLLSAIIVVEPLLRAGITPFLQNGDFFYFLTPFRLDGLAVGSLLALLLESEEAGRFIAKWSGWAGLAVIAVYFALTFLLPASFTLHANSIVYNAAGYSLVALFMGCFVAYVFLNPDVVISKILSSPPFGWFGLMSYGLYLYQSIILSVTEHLWHVKSYPPPDDLLLKLAVYDMPVLVFVAWLSYRLYEVPIMKMGKRMAARLANASSTEPISP